jgi:hypothetical protein
LASAALLASASHAEGPTEARTSAACHPQGAGSNATNPLLPLAPIPGTVEQLPVAVDGSQTPDLIPDAIAYRLFMSAVSVAGAKASSEEFDRRDALLSQVGLSVDDYSRFVAATRHVKDDVDAIVAVRRQMEVQLQGSLAEPNERLLAQFDDLRTRHRVVLNTAVQSAITALTPEGRVQFDTFIRDHVKRLVVIYGAPPLDDEQPVTTGH